MAERASRTLWLLFLALGFMWGSSYLFIKLAVDDFGTFTLVALRLLVGAVYARRNMRGVHPLIPAVFQVSFALLVAGAIAILAERPWDARPDAEAIFSILWLGVLGSGLAYLVVFRLFAAWGATRTTMVAYEIPVWGIVLGFLVLAEPIDVRLLIGTALVVGGVALVNSPYGRRRLFGRVPPVQAT